MGKYVNEQHKERRNFFRVAGPITLGIGFLMFLSGPIGMMTMASDPFSSGFGGPGPSMILPFLGMPLIAAGGFMTKLGYLGAVVDYTAKEVTPATKDAVNYMADGTQEGVRTISKAIHQGMKDASAQKACSQCGTGNDADAAFCDHCGGRFDTERTCGDCGAVNDGDARFCKGCGSTLK